MKSKTKINPDYLASMKEMGLGKRAHKLHSMWENINQKFLEKHPLKEGSIIKIRILDSVSTGKSTNLEYEVTLLEPPTLENRCIVNTTKGRLNIHNLTSVVKY